MLLHLCAMDIAQDKKERQPTANYLFTCFGYAETIQVYELGHIMPHWHTELEILMIDAGALILTVAEQAFSLHAGEGFLLNTGQLHRIQFLFEEPCKYRSLVFDAQILSGNPGSAIDLKYVRPFLTQGAPVILLQQEPWHTEARTLFDDAFVACAEEPNGYELIIRDVLSRLLLLAQTHTLDVVSKPITTQRETQLKQVLLWIDENYSKPFNVQEMAAVINYSVRECQRLFKQLLHLSPQSFLLKRRLIAAMDLLRNPSLSITEIAGLCGFSNHSYFSKQFRLETGISPRQYRSVHITK